MIPIRDPQGRAIGFGARVLHEEPGRPQPKYINSPQTPLFDKSNVLYGLDMAKKAIREADLAVLVEGYMDVLMSHQVGVANVVAGMGTALTEAQMRQLKRYSGNLTLALDPDAAGDHATLRGLEAARQTMDQELQPVFSPTGLLRTESRLKAQLRIAALPDGLDPDELAHADVGRWRQVIADAKPIVDYYLALVGREEDLTTARGKATAVERMAPIIREIANPVEREHQVQRLARLVKADERLIAEQIMRSAAATRGGGPVISRPRRDAPAGAGESSPDAAQKAAGGLAAGQASSASAKEGHLLGCLLSRPDLLGLLDAQLIELSVPPFSPEDFAETENRAVATMLQTNLPAVAAYDPGEILAAMPEPLAEHGRRLLAQVQRRPPLTDERLLKDMGDLVLRLRKDSLHQQVGQLRYLINELEESGSHDQLRPYQELMISYSARIGQLQKLLNSRTMSGALAKMSKGANGALASSST
jgi:DNA primase